MSLAKKLGTGVGIIAAETIWLCETGFKLGIGYYVGRTSIDTLTEIAAQHTINSEDPDAVSDNLLECLEYID